MQSTEGTVLGIVGDTQKSRLLIVCPQVPLQSGKKDKMYADNHTTQNRKDAS